MKVQKPTLDTRATIDTKNTVLGEASIWLEYHPQKTKYFIPTYLRYSNQILNELNRLYPLPSGAKLFTADAVVVYPNINNNEGIATVRKVFKANS